MMTPSLFEESQGFGPWVYALVGLVLLTVAAVATVRMKTVVSNDSVTVRYGFLNLTRVPLSDIQRAEAMVYRPLRDYAGWGVRGGKARRALSARGDRGVLLTLRDGRTLLVGSQRPRDLLAALGRGGVEVKDSLPADIREL